MGSPDQKEGASWTQRGASCWRCAYLPWAPVTLFPFKEILFVVLPCLEMLCGAILAASCIQRKSRGQRRKESSDQTNLEHPLPKLITDPG